MTDARPMTWDLADPTGGRAVPARAAAPVGLRGPAAVVLGAAALVVALQLQLGAVVRWPTGVVLALLALLLAVGGLRRARRLSRLILPVLGVLAAASAVLALVAHPADAAAPDPVNIALPQAAAIPVPGVVTTGSGDPAVLRASLNALLTQVAAMHGSRGPFPQALELQPGGRLTVASGWDRGAVLAILPVDVGVRYAVTPDLRFFRLTLVSDADPATTVSADVAGLPAD